VDVARAIGRRKFLVGGVGVAATAGLLGPLIRPDRAASAPHQYFRHGVASGDPLPDSVVIWTRVTPDPEAIAGSGLGEPTPVRWEVATDDSFSRLVATGAVHTDPLSDHTVKLDVTGLLPESLYWFRFIVRDQVANGRTRTAPEVGSRPERIRFGVVSCSNWQAGYFSAYRHLQDADVDFVIHVGDYLYECEPGMYSYGHEWTDLRRHDPPRETVSLADYRRRHAQYKTDPDLQRLHAQLPFITTWDDHEICDGWYPGGARNHTPWREGPWDKRLAAARRAYDEWMPVRISGTARVGDGDRIYRAFTFGSLVDLSMLDLRGYRDERIFGQNDRHTGAPDRTIMGASQHRWLVDRLTRSPARWKLVGNPVMIAPMLMPPRPQAEQVALLKSTDPMTWGPPERQTDEWDGYPADRRTLLQQIAGVQDVVFLSGDVHTSWANHIPGPDGSSAAVEFVCPSVTSNNVDDFMGTRPRTVSLALEAAITELNPHVDFVNLDDHGYCVLELTDDSAAMEWFAISDRRDPNASARRLAKRGLRAGSSRLRRE
jgi:alkaline phosphatase D